MKTKSWFQAISFGERKVSAELIIGKRSTVTFVLNLIQSKEGVSLMAIPQDPRPLVLWEHDQRVRFFTQLWETFDALGMLSFPFVEVLANQGDQVGQTIPHTHVHCFAGEKVFLLNRGRQNLHSSLRQESGDNLPGDIQYNLYRNSDFAQRQLVIFPRHDLKKSHNPKRKQKYAILNVQDILLPRWELIRDGLRLRFANFFGK